MDRSPLQVHVDSDWAGDLVGRAEHDGTHHPSRSSLAQAHEHAPDVSRTHFYGEAHRWIYVTLPAGYARADEVTRFDRAMYSKQDASSAVLGLQSSFDDCGAKLRHIQVRSRWLQQRVKLGHLTIATVRGIDNPADCLTKALTEADLKRHCEAVGQRWLS